MVRRRFASVASLTLLLVGVVYFAAMWLVSRNAPRITPVTLYVMWEPQAQFLGYYVARSRGFFLDEGLDVTIKHDLGAGESFYHVLTKDRVYTINILSNTLEWLGENRNFAVISIISKGCNMGWLSKFPKEHLPERMRSAQFYSWWGSHDTLLKNFLLERNLMTSTFPSRTHVGSPDVTTGDWAVLVMKYNELFDYRPKVDVEKNFASYCELGVPVFEDVLVGRKPHDAVDRDIHQRMARAIWKGWDWSVRHPGAAVDILMRMNPRRGRLMQEYQLRIFGESLSRPEDVTSNFPAVLETIRQLLRHGLVRNAENVTGVVDALERRSPLRLLEMP